MSVRGDGMIVGSTVGLSTRLGNDVIIRSEIRELSYTVVYEENENPVKRFISGRFTGP